MSFALLPSAGLRWWSENELAHRELSVTTLARTIRDNLLRVNKAWEIVRTEAPMIIPAQMVAPGYTDDDLWSLKAEILGQGSIMRPETTSGSYAVARHLLTSHQKIRLPLCVWQVGKSFRRETNDGASASKLRFFEFTQAEWQCLYSVNTGADYRAALLPVLEKTLGWLTNRETRIVDSDRLPAYSEKTQDVEVLRGDRWTEVASISTRTDFNEDTRVLEIAVGIDRVVDIFFEE